MTLKEQVSDEDRIIRTSSPENRKFVWRFSVRVLVVFGTRPEVIKLAPLIRLLEENRNFFEVVTCSTGQHREMLNQTLSVFDIQPTYDLMLMKENQDLSRLTANVVSGMASILDDTNPQIVIVHGDTTTAFGAALASFYSDIAVGHVESGLRTNHVRSPFPEEMNRYFVDKISTLHFAPTDFCKNNLLREGISENSITVCGNTVVDTLNWTMNLLASDPNLSRGLSHALNRLLGFDLGKKRFLLITGHRRENFGNGIKRICAAINDLSIKYRDVHFVYPVHLNPNIRKEVSKLLQGLNNVHLINPLNYLEFTFLMKNSFLIMTDSGGIQEEAPSLRKPVLLLRDTTERPEGVRAGVVKRIGTESSEIVYEVSNLLDNEDQYLAMIKNGNPFGDGKASERIINTLKSFKS
jgi:UDP-N-acetylglucosamine 2-epimerase (non-hydrolysing)